jgi:hypothetical protein
MNPQFSLAPLTRQAMFFRNRQRIDLSDHCMFAPPAGISVLGLHSPIGCRPSSRIKRSGARDLCLSIKYSPSDFPAVAAV